MKKPTGPLEFEITTHAHLQGCRLSLAGQWGNKPFPTEASAESAARIHSEDRPMTIRHRSYAGTF